MPKTTPAPTALHDPALRQVRATAIALENATIARDAAMVAAKEAGAGVTDIARAAGISRPSVYRVLGGRSALPAPWKWESMMDEALHLLMHYSAATHEIASGLATKDLTAKARRVGYAIKGMRTQPEPFSVDATTIGLASEIAQHILRTTSE